MNWLTNLLKSHWEFIQDIFKIVLQPRPPQESVPVVAPIIMAPVQEAAQEVKLMPRERLYLVAKAALTPPHDISPLDIVDDSVACCESFSDIYFMAFGRYPNQSKTKPTLSTIEMKALFDSMPEHFKKVTEENKGTICLYESGTGNGLYYHGHILILGKFGGMSNNSQDGLWKENYVPLEAMHKQFETKGGFERHLYEPI